MFYKKSLKITKVIRSRKSKYVYYMITASAYRLKETDPEAELPTIPTHPIGYGIAEKILQ